MIMDYKYYVPDDEKCESLKSFKKRFHEGDVPVCKVVNKPIDWEMLFYRHHYIIEDGNNDIITF